MCSIIGTESRCTEVADFFARSKSRGPDMTRIEEAGAGYLGFNRLSIMGLDESGMQPFHLDGDMVVCNGEIYGFRAIKEALLHKYTFASGSDCELLLPMYREYGLSMFEKLDSEFAVILYDSKTGRLVAARDPIGIRPLYYGYLEDGAIAFASEPKCLIGLADSIAPFPPGHYYADGAFTRFADIAEAEPSFTADLDTVCAGIKSRLIKAVEKRMDADAKVGFLLSGGLDSSLVCAIAARMTDKPIRTFAIGMDKDAIDLKYARMVADHIGADHTEVFMTAEDVLSSLDDVVKLLGTYDITTIRASMGMYLVCKYIHEKTDVRVLLTGEVSDELFGYKYTDFAPSPEAFNCEAQKRVRELHMYDVLRADRCISVNSLEARVPFGDLDFVRYVMHIDPRLKMNSYKMGKYLLRRAFDDGENWLPRQILLREKAAFSDAVGHSMVDDLKALAEAKYPDISGAQKYVHAKPFTKESLMYRDIFEKHYPGMSSMVKDFWMPNREWEGCDVNDPSARVLSNYGASGE